MVQLNTTAGSENYNCARTKITFVTTTYLELLFRAALVLNRIALAKIQTFTLFVKVIFQLRPMTSLTSKS